ncbi:hypothetical protein CC202_21860, partial [Pseudomonas savastanoi]
MRGGRLKTLTVQLQVPGHCQQFGASQNLELFLIQVQQTGHRVGHHGELTHLELLPRQLCRAGAFGEQQHCRMTRRLSEASAQRIERHSHLVLIHGLSQIVVLRQP